MRCRFGLPVFWACFAAAAAIGAGPATGEIVHFVNPAPGEVGHYDWRWPGEIFAPPSWLDITRGAAEQLNTINGSSVAQTGFGSWLDSFNSTFDGAAVAVHLDEFFGAYTRALGAGDTLLGWEYAQFSLHHYWNSEQPMPAWGESFFPVGERRYLGVLTADGRHGWIEVERTGGNLTAYSWAYETAPGVPITAGQVPAPGAAVLLGIGTLTLRRNRT